MGQPFRPPMNTSFAYIRPLLLAALLVPLVTLRAQEAPAPRTRSNFDAGWLFQQGDAPNAGDTLSYAKIKDAVIASSADFLAKDKPTAVNVPRDLGKSVVWTQPDFDDTAWRKLDLPHDWGIEGKFDQALPGDTGKLPWQGVGWYRKHFTVDATAKNRCVFVDFDGAMAYATVWCNGQFVGGWPYGYASFELDVTPFLKVGGDNVLAVRLENPPKSSRWYPGAGIYRHVWLVETNPLHVAHWGTQVMTLELTPERAVMKIGVSALSKAEKATGFKVETSIYASDADGHPVGERVDEVKERSDKVVSGESPDFIPVEHSITRPKLWDLQHPNLYVAVTTIWSGTGSLVLPIDKPLDRVETVFGLRKIEFTADKGFLLNGQRVPLQGVCDHHDLGALGTALNDTALKRQLSILKEMGCNAIRTSHNPPSPELLDDCDRLGLLVMDESFDCWKKGKNPNDYNKLWSDWHEKDLRALVRRDRNHPSVILWSIGNEVPDQGTPEGPALAKELTAIAHDEDGGDALSRRTTAACDRTESGFNDFHKGLDVMGFNYKPTQYNRFHEANPQQPVIGTETSSCVSTRGFYTFPVSEDKAKGQANFQVSDYDLSAPSWANPPDSDFKGLDDAPFTGGEFVWTGFDYLGEPTPYGDDWHKDEPDKGTSPSRSSYFGIIDLAGFPKNRYYEYQARWRPELPMAHILPDWTWPDRVGQVTPIHVFTSGDEAELFLNGESLGRKKKGPREYRLRWDDVKYAPGEVKVVAYKDGKEWATDTVKTAGEPVRVSLVAEDETMHGGIAYLDATLVDKDGTPVPHASNKIKFTVVGQGEFVATDNGDATSHESFQAHECRAFNGKCLVIIRAKEGASRSSMVRAESDGLQAGEAGVLIH